MITLLKDVAKWVKFRSIGATRGIRIGRRCRIGFTSELEGGNSIQDGTAFSGRLGFGSYLGRDCRIVASVGRYCSISSEVITVGGRHPASEFVSTHPAFYSLAKQSGFTYVQTQLFEEHAWADPQHEFSVVIGSDVLVSQGVRILEGVRIGDGAILGAGCLVRSDVEPFAIYAGVPARKIGQRFDDETIRQLLEIRWWDRGQAWVSAHAPLFSDVPRFLDACREECLARASTTHQESGAGGP